MSPIVIPDPLAINDQYLREPLRQQANSTAWPRGIEAVLHYGDQGQYVLNDRRRVEGIFVDELGFGRPDVLAAAEKNPDRDGELPLDPSYGGRTITLKGWVVAGSLDKMRQLYEGIEDAFDDIREQPLWMRWLDWRDNFVDSQALVDYTYDSGTGTLISGPTGLQPTDTTTKSLIVYPIVGDGSSPARLARADAEGTLAFNASVVTAMKIGLEFRRAAGSQKIRAVYDHAAATLSVYKIIAGTPTQISSVAVAPTLSANTTYYLRVRAEGAVITYWLWSSYPPDIGGTPIAAGSLTLSAPEQAAFPSGIEGVPWGIYWIPGSTSDRITMLDVGALDRGDALIYCRKAAPIDPGPETQIDWRYRRPFMITLRASDARMVSRKLSYTSIVPSSFALLFPGGGGGFTFPADGSGLVFGAYLPSEITNLGRSPATMTIRFYGPMQNPVLLHPASGKSVGIDGTIASGDYVEFDTARRTVYDQSGASRYSMLTDDTSWPELASGVNQLVLGADSVSGIGQIFFAYRHSSR